MTKNLCIETLLLLGALLSCTRETQPQAFTLEATMPEIETRTVLGPKSAGAYPILWSAGDRITVNGIQSRELPLLDAGAKTATFHFEESISAPYNVLYGGVPGTDNTIEIPEVQVYAEANIRNGYAPMYAASSEAGFSMNHLSGILSLPVKGDATLTGLTLTAPDGTPVAGRYRLEKDGALFSGETTVQAGSAQVHLTLPDGGVDISAGKTFCFAVHPGTFSKGLSLDIYASDGSRMNLCLLPGGTVSKGSVYEFPQTTFTPNVTSVIPISSYAELKAFCQRVATGEKYLHARLMADIAVDSHWTPLDGFSGDLDGGGHTISGLRKALFNELLGSVRNLTLEGKLNISKADDIVGEASVYWAGLLANRLFTGASVSHCVTKGSIRYAQWGKELRVGAFAGYAARGSVEHCVNRADITAVGDGSAVIQAGGIIGRAYSANEAITIRDCRNEGNLTLQGTVKTAALGGITGHFDPVHTSVLTGDAYTGTISVDASARIQGVLNIGGVAGFSLDDLDGCSFGGKIHFSAPTTYIQNVGGIVGNAVTSSIKDCENTGEILGNAATSGVIRCGGIAGWASEDGTVTDIALTGCRFTGSIAFRIGSHSTLYAKPITGLYSTHTHSETDCISTGTITTE